ncbi:uncharacterized protein LOC114352467 [Ostrinia furnacalis]|uniref:uncharacterized protein LOC114352467 n=1 Tax=Ostrinia furnacalis TaxID=93504 RepID=UPI00103DA819|nr:uncharacterized protein LOC114352467 [Ostrinia furnacalis]
MAILCCLSLSLREVKLSLDRDEINKKNFSPQSSEQIKYLPFPPGAPGVRTCPRYIFKKLRARSVFKMPNKPKQKKTVNYPPESLVAALKDIREDGQGIRETCRKYGIPRTTIQDRISGRRTDKIRNRGPAPILGNTGEQQVVEWLNNIAKCNFPVKKQEILDTVQKILQDLKQPNPFKGGRPGQTWHLGFLKRNPEISRRSAEGKNKARERATEKSIRQWFQELETFLSESRQSEILQEPERIFNCAESGFLLCPETGELLGPKGFGNVHQIEAGDENDILTVLLTLNASGQVCPPLVIFPYLRLPKAVTDNTLKEWTFGKSETGWINNDIFYEYIVNNFNSWLEKNYTKRPILLLTDGYKTPMSLTLSSVCEKLGIILYSLPPNSTQILQPAIITVLGPLKANWRNVEKKFLTKPENFNIPVICSLFKEIIDAPELPTNIINGFRKCGLFPYNPDAVDYTKCEKNTMESPDRLEDNEETRVTDQDVDSTQKVLTNLTPILKKKNVDVEFILSEVNKLRKTEPEEPQILSANVRLYSSVLNTGMDDYTHYSRPYILDNNPFFLPPPVDDISVETDDEEVQYNSRYIEPVRNVERKCILF